VPTGHPSLHQLYGKSYEDRIENGTPVSDAWINEKPARLWSVRHYQKVLPNFTHLPEHRQRCWWYIGVYPNLVFGFYPEMVEYYMTLPVSCSETRYIGGCYALPDSRRETIAARYLNRRINERTDVEDESFVRDMQQNMRSSAFPQPVFSQLERGVLEFHQKIMRDIPVAKVQEQPEPGQLVRLNQQMRST